MKNLGIGILLICMALWCLPGCSAATISVSQASIAGPGMTGSVDLTLDVADQGLSGYILSVYPEDPAIVTISGASFPPWASLSDATPGSGSEMTIRALDLNESVNPGAQNVVLATLNLNGVASGSTRIMVKITQIDDDQGSSITPQITPGSITVAGGGTGEQIDIALVPGWNFISIPMVLASGSDTAEVFKDIPSGGHSVFTYDPTAGWKTIGRTELLSAMNAYWIYSEQALTIPLKATGRPTSPKSLSTGWSIMGIPGTVQVPASQALSSIAEWTYVIGFDSGLQQYNQPIIKGGTGPNSDTTPLVPGSGYWIYLPAPGQLTP